ncbi:MAG: hypothetical protein JSS99_14285 [Actinobacteria bacterium]|nr:hypothetical protein [Actinomycetota bacterium]
MPAFSDVPVGPLVVFWKHIPDRRGRVVVSEGDLGTTAFLSRLLERIPGGTAHQASVKASLGRIREPGASVTVTLGHAHNVGIARPMLPGDDRLTAEPFMLALLVRHEFRGVCLFPSVAAAATFVRERTRKGLEAPWVGFAGEMASSASNAMFHRTQLENLVDASLPEYRHLPRGDPTIPPFVRTWRATERRAS